ncbi:DUF58 domain-containing protein [Kaarinaea lacus]
MKPSSFTLLLLFFWALLGVAAAYQAEAVQLWNAAGIVLVVVLLFDAFNVYREPNIRIERHLAHNLPVNSWSHCKLIIRNQGDRDYELQIYDLHPGRFKTSGLPIALKLGRGLFSEAQYRLLPTQRGDEHFSGLHVRVVSRFGLWIRQRTYHLEESVKIYPNFAEVAKYALLAIDNKLSHLGVRHRQRRGQGLEFHQLREYRDGDSLRQIDWKATSRYQKLISKEYQDERDQQVVFLIDCGRRMRAVDDNVSHFDQALNALLLLSYVALRQGDSVSFHAFGGQQRWFNARKGAHNINAILNQLYDLDTTLEVADYTTAARELLSRQNKRSLVVMLTNARDEDYEDLNVAMRLLRSRHLVLLANLREEVLDGVTQQSVHDFDDAVRYSAVMDYLNKRDRIHNQLGDSGVIALNVTAEQLPITVVNRYLDIKRSNML